MMASATLALEEPRLHVALTEEIKPHPALVAVSQSVTAQSIRALKEEYPHLQTENLIKWHDAIVTSQQSVLNEEDAIGPYRQWSPSAVSCFVRNADCSGCYYQNFFSESTQGCQMNEAVRHLLAKLGPPNKRHINKLS
ncbi:MAG: hypothetical protein HEQ32_00160 [Vampirovibrio sp.]|jgi:hypothetical protein